MATHSPRPIAHRAFSMLIAVLLVTSMAAPIAASGTASATTATTVQETSLEETCDSNLKYALPHSCGLAYPDDEVAKNLSEDETNLHVISTSEGESVEAHYQGVDNYLQDTNTIASLEARNAIAQAYEDGKSESEAYSDALDAINNYYATHQEQHLAVLEKAMLQYYYVVETATSSDSVNDEFLSGSFQLSNTEDYSVNGNDLVKTNATIDLTNGDNVTIRTLRHEVLYSTSADDFTNSYQYKPSSWTDESASLYYDESEDIFRVPNSPVDQEFSTSGKLIVMNVGSNLESQSVFDLREWDQRWHEMEQKSQTVRANYDSQFVSDLYSAMDSGQIDPADVRGAEGQARFLSGDSEVTSERFRLSVQSMLDMSSPDMSEASSMVVEYTGATGVEYVEENGNRTQKYVDPVENEEYQGLLFSSEVPDNGFEVNTTYNTENLNGTVRMFDETTGETTDFEQGNFTVLEMYDSDGNAVNETSWDDPKYDAYDVEEFAAYIENATELQKTIAEQYEEDENDGITIPNPFGGDGAGGALLGVGIIAVVILLVAGFVTDLIPGVGN